ncbi:TIGR00282 family metallophosphoesterase [Paracoccaceae bacterium]|nr:TIGR00282 family metallophosphoesterase [Paracoccaceae bacterium]
MKILFLGDVVGRSGRSAVIKHLPSLIKKNLIDFSIVNAENATSGMGLSAKHAKEILEIGANCITLGDHAFDQKDMLQFIEQEDRILRPLNFSKSAPGKGSKIYADKRGRKILVSQVLGQVFMKRPFDDPFSEIDGLLRKNILGGAVQASFVDIHCEATSEKMALGHFCDGRVSAVIGTHTHVPTSDTMILPKGTAYQTDAGMCGSFNSVIGMDKAEPLRRFVTGMSKERFKPAEDEGTLCGAIIETDDKSGLAESVKMLRLGGRLEST